MISDNLLDTHSKLFPFGELLILSSLVIFAPILYAVLRGLRSAYVQQARQFSRCRLTGREVVCLLLEHLGLPADRCDAGAKIDHYDLWRHRVRLRTESSVSSSVAALAIAAHEVGHAEQFATGYWAARATRGLLLLLVLGGTILFVYPFAVLIGSAGDVNLTGLIAILAILPVLRLPVTIALERDASTRAKRLLDETRLADDKEKAGIDRLLSAALRTHLVLSVGLIVLVCACVATMSLVESGLNLSLPTMMQVAVSSEIDPSRQLPQFQVQNLDGGDGEFPYTLAMVALSLGLVWWAFRSPARKPPVRKAVDVNNEGMARFQAGDPAGAIVLFDEALRLDPGLATAHYNRAVALSSQGRSELALASIDAMLACRTEEVEPFLGLSDMWFLRGTLRLDQGDYQGAVDDLSRAFDLDPVEPAILLRNRGLAWIKLGQLDRALQDTDAALSLAPGDAVAYNNRGVIYRDQGHLEQAEADLRRALEIDPQLPTPSEHLAKLLELKREAAAVQPRV